VIVNFPRTDAMADETFGKDGYRIVELPCFGNGKDLPKHYLRYTSQGSIGVNLPVLFTLCELRA